MSYQVSGMRKAQEREMLPTIDLFPQAEYNGRKIDASVFGPNTYSNNLAKMQKRYFHSNDLPNATFKPLTPAESLAVASYNFKNLVRPIFDNNWLQAGLILRVSEGVWIAPLIDTNGAIIEDVRKLEKRLDRVKKVNGIYLLDGDTSFVPYGSFEQGWQEHEEFLEGGLARGLVHTAAQKAVTLSSIANNKEYPLGVNVWGFNSVSKPVVKVVGLFSNGSSVGNRLIVGGSNWDGSGGFALGGLVSGEASAKKS